MERTAKGHILLVVYRFPRASSMPIVSGEIKHPWNLARWLCEAGYKVTVLSCDDADETYQHSQLNVEVISIGVNGGRGVFRHYRRAWRIFRSIRALVRTRAVSVVHTHVAYGALAAVLATRQPTKVVSTAHGTNIPEISTELRRVPARRLLRWVNAWGQALLDAVGWRYAHAVVSVSRYQMRELISIYRVKKERVHVVSTGVDERYAFSIAGRERLRRDLGVSADARVLLMVGRLAHKKRFAWAISALSRIPRNLASFELVLVTGSDEFVTDRSSLEAELQRADLGIRVHVRHAVAEDDMPGYYAASDVVVVPSEGYESLPNVILEARMSGAEVVATRAWGNVEILERHSTFEEHDEGEFALRIVEALHRSSQGVGRPSLVAETVFHRAEVLRRLGDLYAV